jgi:hypothetical protein
VLASRHAVTQTSHMPSGPDHRREPRRIEWRRASPYARQPGGRERQPHGRCCRRDCRPGPPSSAMQEHRASAQDGQAGAEQVNCVSGARPRIWRVARTGARFRVDDAYVGTSMGVRRRAGRVGRWPDVGVREDPHAHVTGEDVVAGDAHHHEQRRHRAGDQPTQGRLAVRPCPRAHQRDRTHCGWMHTGVAPTRPGHPRWQAPPKEGIAQGRETPPTDPKASRRRFRRSEAVSRCRSWSIGEPLRTENQMS